MLSSQQELLTLSNVARVLGVSRRVVSDYARDRGLPVIRISKRMVRVHPQALDAWLAAHTEGATAPREVVTD